MALHRSWSLRVALIGLMFASGCASTPTAPTPDPPAPQTSATAGDTTIVAIAPPAKQCCPHPTLLDFLGITQVAKGVAGLTGRLGSRIRARLGVRFPGLEAKPPLVALTDPANLSEDASPAQQAAASAKKEEDAAPQKAKALKYLATLGCGGCYPDVEKALLSALEDCTEEVRFAAVSSIRDTTFCPCVYCNADGCCSPNVQQALRKVAYETKDNGCYFEPSARVRRVARIALVQCSCVPIPVDAIEAEGQPELPSEGPTQDDITTDNDTAVQLASFEAATPTLPNFDAEQLLVTVNGQPIFMKTIEGNLVDRWAKIPLDHRGDELWARIVGQETERAIDDLLLHQLRGANSVWNPRAMQTPSFPLPSLEPFAELRNSNREWLHGHLTVDRQVNPTELSARLASLPKPEAPAPEVRYEQITVRFDVGQRDQAYRVASWLRARMLGTILDPPEAFQQESIESKKHDWRTAESIGSPVISAAAFSLPPGQISSVIEADNGWHLIRVLERRVNEPESPAAVAEKARAEIISRRVRLAEHAFFTDARRYANIWRPE